MLPLLCLGIFGIVLILTSIVVVFGNPFRAILDYRFICLKCGWHCRSEHATSPHVGRPTFGFQRNCPKCMNPAPGPGDGGDWVVKKMRGTPIAELSNPFTWWKWRWDEVD